MIYDTLNGYTCRKGVIKDYDRIVELMAPFVTTEGAHESFNKMEIRSLAKATRFFLMSGECVVVEKDDAIVSVYTGRDTKIGSLGNVGGVNAIVLLLKVALCDIQSLYKEATFQVANDNIRKIYDSIKTPSGKACTIDEQGNGVVSIVAKKEILDLFNRLKG